MGIDYGIGKTNIDNDTGIRFGVIQADEVGSYWYDDSELSTPEKCPNCGSDFSFYEVENENEIPCSGCFEIIDLESIESTSCFVNTDKLIAEQDIDSPDISIIESEFYTICGSCSPWAGYLTDQSQDCKAYCFGHDWFENNQAPYKVFRVSDNSEVLPE